MILLQISDGTTTKYLCDINSALVETKTTGYELDSQFYEPGITNQTNINLGLNGNFGSINQSYIKIDRELVYGMTKDELTASIWLWDEKSTSSKFKVFSGVVALREKNSIEYTYQIRQSNGNLDADLLSAAPDLKTLIGDTSTFNDGRVYPYYFGYLKYVTPLMLAKSTGGGVYYSEGEVAKMHDGGQSVRFTQSTTEVTKTTTKSVYEITLDIDSSSASAGSDTTSPSLVIQNTTFYSSTAPATSTHTLKDGDIWVDTDTQEIFVWNGSNWNQKIGDTTSNAINRNITVNTSGGGIRAGKSSVNDTTNAGWAIEIDGSTPEMFLSNANFERGLRWDGTRMETRGVILNINGTATTATRITILGAYISDQSGVSSSNRLNYSITEDGQLHQYIWTDPPGAPTEKWYEITSIGQSTFLGDYTNAFFGNLEMAIYGDTNLTDIGVVSLGKDTGIVAQGTLSASVGGNFSGSGAGVKCNGSSDGDIVLVGASSDPSGPTAGAIYYNTSTGKFRGFNGTIWQDFN